MVKISDLKYWLHIFWPITFFVFFECNKKDTRQGEELAKTYCANCHQFPEPDLLPKNVWEKSTLPYMGMMLGVEKAVADLPEMLRSYSFLKPDNQMVTEEQWEQIEEYYLDKAPKKLAFDKPVDLTLETQLFSVEKLKTPTKANLANYTYLGFHKKNHQIIAGDQANASIEIFDSACKLTQNYQNQNALSYINFDGKPTGTDLLTFMGKTTQANQEIKGSVVEMNLNSGSNSPTIIIENLDRPVSTIAVNLDQTSDSELITSEFGFVTGGVAIWKKDNNGQFQKKYLSQSPGVVKTLVLDYDGDHLLDIVTLFAQGNERLVFFKNKGNLVFEEIQLLKFPPIYGSNYFELLDITGDGKLDVVYACGDNDDFTTILKPYHGVYIFENMGNNNFKKIKFFPQNGACKVVSGDFDLDGDTDLVSISLFPDVEGRPSEGFIYFENNKMNFKLKTLNINHLGRWSVMDAGDLDGDGDLDLVLGSHPIAKFPAGFDQAWKQGSGLLILRNNAIKKGAN